MAAPDVAEIRRLLHALRDPLGAFAIDIELLRREPQSPAAVVLIKNMSAAMGSAADALEAIDFVLQNGHKRPARLQR